LNHSSFIVKKGLIKYGKINDIMPMTTHVDNVHPHLLTKRKSVLSEKAVDKLFEVKHNWQHEKKKVGATSFSITFFLGVNKPIQECL
jgi:hypothetical protein